jgi:hypothetical protein
MHGRGRDALEQLLQAAAPHRDLLGYAPDDDTLGDWLRN